MVSKEDVVSIEQTPGPGDSSTTYQFNNPGSALSLFGHVAQSTGGDHYDDLGSRRAQASQHDTV